MMIEAIYEKDQKAWTQQIEEFDYSVFMTLQWLESVSNEHLVPVCFNLENETRVIAKMAGLSVGRRGSVKHKLFFYTGPALHKSLPSSALHDCLTAIISYAKKNTYNRLVVYTYDYRQMIINHPKMNFKNRSEFGIDLTQNCQSIIKNMDRHIGRYSRRATNSGYTVEESKDVQLTDQLIRLMEQTKQIRLLKKNPDYNYFYMLYVNSETFRKLVQKEAVTFFVAKKDQTIFGIQAIITIQQKAYALFTGHSEQSYANGIPAFLNYNTIFSLKEQGFKHLSFGGVTGDSSRVGLIKFKKRMGCAEFETLYGSTSFLQFPYVLLNPVVKISKFLPPTKLTNGLRNIW